MTAPPSIDLSGWLSEQLGQASPDLLRQMITTFVEALMGAEADAVCGAEYGVRSERTHEHPQRLPASGVGHPRRHDRVGDPEAAVRVRTSRTGCSSGAAAPRPRCVRSWRRVLPARGVSTRRMEKLVETLGITRLVEVAGQSVMAKDLDEQVEAFRTRPLDAGPYTFLAADALVLKVREAKRTVNVHALLAVGVNADGLPRDPRPARHQRRGRRRLAGVLPRPHRPRPVRRRAGHQRRAPRPGRGHRRHAARREPGSAAAPTTRRT